ncbi:MAG: ABC transporter substrate-binding protein, partial [Dehalococcoidia bacterium]|nr:ABC transporter substrate-binding protein [Dehalococcoidia bacterium]
MKRFCKQIFALGTNWFLVLLSLVLVLTACSPTEQTPPQYVFDDLGRLVAINGTPQRIISLAPSITETLFALGLGDRVVGVTDWC